MLGLCVTQNEGMWLVSVGIRAFLEQEWNIKDHRFQQPQLWVSNWVVAMARVVFLSFLVSLKGYQAGQVVLLIHIYVTFRRK